MTEKRFNIKPSVIVDDVTVIIDSEKKYTFPVLDSTLNYMFCKAMNELNDENEQLKLENKRLTDKLNKTALELVDECISQGKATEISEMSYREFLDYRAENGKPMELQL